MKNILAAKLRELRGEMSQSDFAAKIGVKQTSYSSWERGVKDPVAQTLVQISNTLGVSVDWLLGLSDTRGPAQVAAPIQPPGSTVRSQKRGAALAPQSNSELLAEIRALKARVAALESQPAFACG